MDDLVIDDSLPFGVDEDGHENILQYGPLLLKTATKVRWKATGTDLRAKYVFPLAGGKGVLSQGMKVVIVK